MAKVRRIIALMVDVVCDITVDLLLYLWDELSMRRSRDRGEFVDGSSRLPVSTSGIVLPKARLGALVIRQATRRESANPMGQIMH